MIMRVAVLVRSYDPPSHRIYREKVTRALEALGIRIVSQRRWQLPPRDCDLVWDYGLGMRPIPVVLRKRSIPVVATFHGARIFASVYQAEKEWALARICHPWLRVRLRQDAEWFRSVVAALIVPSRYAAQEAAHVFGVPFEKIHVVPHGVDHRIFTPEGECWVGERPYVLHIAGQNPMKNTERVLAAYARLPESGRPDLVLISPWDWHRPPVRGVRMIRRLLSQEELARWYRGALALVAPSLRETFGMALLEAMACGCPVITSNRSGCAEVAGEAALLVDPHSVEEIAAAMWRVIEDQTLRAHLREQGIDRALTFSWERTATEHVRVFQSVLTGGSASPC
jgi:glycosyltransferase involved in cell wall biosynthesis